MFRIYNKETDIFNSKAAWSVIKAISDGNVTPKQVEKNIAFSRFTVQRYLNEMERLNLLKRTPKKEKRNVTINLTEYGIEFLQIVLNLEELEKKLRGDF